MGTSGGFALEKIQEATSITQREVTNRMLAELERRRLENPRLYVAKDLDTGKVNLSTLQCWLCMIAGILGPGPIIEKTTRKDLLCTRVFVP